MQLNARRDVYEYGLLPLHALCTSLDNATTLYGLHARLMERSTTAPSGQKVVACADVGAVLGLTATQQEVLLQVLNALSLSADSVSGGGGGGGSGPSPMDCSPSLGGGSGGAGGTEVVVLHELSLFLLLQLYSKEAVRSDNLEVWPDTLRLDSAGGSGGSGGSPFEFARPGTPEGLSPTRQSLARSPSAGSNSRLVLRQQLQQHVRQQVSVVRGFGDFVRRNLRMVLDLCLDVPPPAPSPQGGSSGGGTGSPAAALRISAREVDRAEFLIGSLRGSPAAASGASLGGQMPLLAGGGTAPVDAVVALLRQSWTESAPVELGGGIGTAESPRMMAIASMFSSSSSTTSSASGASGAAGLSASYTLSRSSSAGRVVGAPIAAAPAVVDEAVISGVVKGTVVRAETAGAAQATELRIADCHDAVLYVLAPVQCVYVVGCSDCTILLGAVGSLVRLERCDKLQVIAATSRIIISSCHECSLYLGVNHSPVIIGDNRFLRLAPFNARYERQLQHLRDASVRLDVPNRWDTPLVLAAKERKGPHGSPDSPRAFANTPALKPSFSLLPPEEFLPFVVPFQGAAGPLAGGPAAPQATRWANMAAMNTARSSAAAAHSPPPPTGGASSAASGAPLSAPLYLFPLPADYEHALHRKLSMTTELRVRFKQAGLGRDKERELNDAIQGHFREWLSTSSMLRQIYDLSNLEKDEQQAATAAAAMTSPPQHP